MVKVIPYGRQSISEEDIASVVRVLKGDYLTQGPAVSEFEKVLKEFLGCEYAVAVSNGTAALHLISLALGLKPGDAVIVPAITFAATANAVLYCGATPIFADIEHETYGMCPISAEEAIQKAKQAGLNVKAIFGVHYAGLPCKINELAQLATKHGAVFVEDACHALGAGYGARSMVGDGQAAIMSAWSFHPVKHIATGEGGAVTTNNGELARKLEMLRTHGITKQADVFINKNSAVDKSGLKNSWYMEMQYLGYNYRIPDILAALGVSQMRSLSRFVEERRRIAKEYDKELIGCEHITTPPGDYSFGKHAYHLYPIQIDFKSIGKTRARIISELNERDIAPQVHYIPVYEHPYYQQNENRWLKVTCSRAERFYENELSLPMYPALSRNDQQLVCRAIKEVVQ